MGLGYELRPVQLVNGGPTYLAHSSASIMPEAVIGEGVIIHAGAVIEGEAALADGSIVGMGAHINGGHLADGAAAWDHSQVRPGARLGAGAAIGHASVVNTNVQIGPYSRIQNHVSIPEGITVASSVFIGPGAKFPNDRHPRAFGPWEVGETTIEFGASIGANATVVCGERDKPMRVGAFATLAAGSVATKPLRPFGLYNGNEQIGWVDPCGFTLSHNADKVPSFWRLTSELDDALAADTRLTPERRAEIKRHVAAAYAELQS